MIKPSFAQYIRLSQPGEGRGVPTGLGTEFRTLSPFSQLSRQTRMLEFSQAQPALSKAKCRENRWQSELLLSARASVSSTITREAVYLRRWCWAPRRPGPFCYPRSHHFLALLEPNDNPADVPTTRPRNRGHYSEDTWLSAS